MRAGRSVQKPDCRIPLNATVRLIKQALAETKQEETSNTATLSIYDARGNRRKPHKKEELARMQEVILNQLAVGKSRVLQSFRRMIGEATDDLCPYCQEQAETTEHLLIECPAHRSKRGWLDTEGLGVGVIRAQPKETVNFLHAIGKIDNERQVALETKTPKRKRPEEGEEAQPAGKKRRRDNAQPEPQPTQPPQPPQTPHRHHQTPTKQPLDNPRTPSKQPQETTGHPPEAKNTNKNPP